MNVRVRMFSCWLSGGNKEFVPAGPPAGIHWEVFVRCLLMSDYRGTEAIKDPGYQAWLCGTSCRDSGVLGVLVSLC